VLALPIVNGRKNNVPWNTLHNCLARHIFFIQMVMKPAILFLLMLILCSLFPAKAQEEHWKRKAISPLKEARFFAGATLGLGYSTILPYRNTRFHSSCNLGALFRYELSTNFGLSSALLVSREGLSLMSGDELKVEHLDYLRLPLMALYRFDCGIKDLCPEAGIGATGGILLKKKDHQFFSLYDGGIQTQIGFRYRLLRGLHLNLCIQHYRGLIDILSGNRMREQNQSTRLQLTLLAGF